LTNSLIGHNTVTYKNHKLVSKTDEIKLRRAENWRQIAARESRLEHEIKIYKKY